MSISKAIKQVLSVVKEILNQVKLSFGEKVYKTYPVANVKINDAFAQIYESMMGVKCTLKDFDVIGKFSDDKKFEGFCITYCIPSGVVDLFPNGLKIDFPMPLVNTAGGWMRKFEIDERTIAMLYLEKENPFDWGGSCEVFYGEIDLSKVYEIAGEWRFEQKPNYSCELDVTEHIDRSYTKTKPQVYFNGDSLNNVGQSIVLMKGESFSLAEPVFKENMSGMGVEGVSSYILEVEEGVNVIVLDILLNDINQLFAVAGADLEYYQQWMLKHQVAYCNIFNGFGTFQISKFKGKKGIYSLGIGRQPEM